MNKLLFMSLIWVGIFYSPVTEPLETKTKEYIKTATWTGAGIVAGLVAISVFHKMSHANQALEKLMGQAKYNSIDPYQLKKITASCFSAGMGSLASALFSYFAFKKAYVTARQAK